MKRRVRASAKTREALEELFSGGGGGERERSELVQLATRLIVEEALESEVDDWLGCGYYGVAPENARKISGRGDRI